MNKQGALPYQMIVQLIEGGVVKGGDKKCAGPASLDLRLSEEVYRVEGVFQPRSRESIRKLVKEAGGVPHDLKNPLERGVMYLARLEEVVELPRSIYAYCNPKSSTGRNDIHVRVLADGVRRFDAVTHDNHGGPEAPKELWVAICSRSFAVILGVGMALAQIRFFDRDTRLSETELELFMLRDMLLAHPEGEKIEYRDISISDRDGSLILTLDCHSKVLGWQARETAAVLDLTKSLGAYPAEDFFTPSVLNKKGLLSLERDRFYILSTRERIRVPPGLACEMAPMDDRSGEFRSHYAGFIDPGWGWGKKGEGAGRPLTLEVRPFENILVRPDQGIARIRFERMIDVPDVQYDEVGTYVTQEIAKLSKWFH